MGKSGQDYRNILKERLALKKQDGTKYTQSYFARKMGVSKSYLTAVLSCKKHLSAEKLDLLCRALQLGEEDCLAVLLSYSQQVHSQKYLSKTLSSLIHTHRLFSTARTIKRMSPAEKSLTVDEVRSTLFSLMSSIPNGDVGRAHAVFRNKDISLSEAKKALTWLEKNNFLTLENNEGKKRYKARQSYISNQLPAGFQKYIPWTENIIHMMHQPEAYRPARVQSMTFSFNDQTLLQLQDAYTAFRARIKELSDQSAPEGKVYVLYLQNVFYTLASIDNSEEA